jgi:hypothetical protein
LAATTAPKPAGSERPTNVPVSFEAKGESTTPTKSRRPGWTYIVGIQAQECQGLVWDWSHLPWSILTDSPQIESPSDRPLIWPIPESDHSPAVPREPPVPPPRESGSSSFVA